MCFKCIQEFKCILQLPLCEHLYSILTLFTLPFTPSIGSFLHFLATLYSLGRQFLNVHGASIFFLWVLALIQTHVATTTLRIKDNFITPKNYFVLDLCSQTFH